MLTPEAIQKKKLYAGEKKASMLRRADFNDYYSRQMYMVTITTLDRRHPWLGEVTGTTAAPMGSADYPHIELSPLGAAVRDEWLAIPIRSPEISLLAFQVMPDHLHGILFVQEGMKLHLGNIIGRFKAYTNKAYCRIILHEDPTKPREGKPRDHLLWQHGYNDKILYHEGQLQAWTNYIHQNPYRLVLKRENPDLFRVSFNLNYGPYTFSSIGNRFLLTYPGKLQLQCSRSLTPEQVEQKKQELLSKARQGTVFISPAISPGEKTIMRAILNAGHRLILLRENGFTFLSKPGGSQFMEACASGNLLMLSPWEHHNDQRKIQRSQCLTLNTIAKYIAETPPPIII